MHKSTTVANLNRKTIVIILLILVLLVSSSMACLIGGGGGGDNGADSPTTGWSAEQAINATQTASVQMWHAQLTAQAAERRVFP